MSKQRIRLTDQEAEYLNLPVKNRIEGKGNPKYYLDSDQYKDLMTFRGSEKDSKYEVAAWDSNGKIMTIDEFCLAHGLDRGSIKNWRLCTHTKVPTYNISFKDDLVDSNDFNYDEIVKILEKDIKEKVSIKRAKTNNKFEGVLKWADLHVGAHIRNVINVDNYDSKIIKKNLLKSVDNVNLLKFKKVHVHIHGDLIESFTGLNHINSWRSMEKDLIGAKLIRVCSQILHNALKEIKNLGKIKIVAGNHDRISKNNDEDVKGGAADILAYTLELMGYDVEFNPMVISHKVDKINYIILHGDKGLSKMSTSDLILNYGKQGIYNYICEAHLHSIIEKLTTRQRETFKIVKDDNILCRREHLASFMPGNFYSSSNGWSTNTGYQINWCTERGRPVVLKSSF